MHWNDIQCDHYSHDDDHVDGDDNVDGDDDDDDDLDREGQVDLCQDERTTRVQHSLFPENIGDISPG